MNQREKNMEINRVAENERIGEFINAEFSDYATDCDVALNYEEFCFAAEDDGKIAGVITGRAYYNEVYIGDLIVGKGYRRDGVGSKLVAAVEEAYKGKGYEKIALTTFGFQAPEFYKKLGYQLEFVRKDKDPKLSKYFYLKKINFLPGMIEKETDIQILINNIDRVHTTNMGADRIKKNLSLGEADVVEWCKSKILSEKAEISRQGKNWYICIEGSIITVNAGSYTIITAHKEKQ